MQGQPVSGTITDIAPDGGTRQGARYGETKEQLYERRLSLWRTARLLFAVD